MNICGDMAIYVWKNDGKWFEYSVEGAGAGSSDEERGVRNEDRKGR
jgi:hypothetical protein